MAGSFVKLNGSGNTASSTSIVQASITYTAGRKPVVEIKCNGSTTVTCTVSDGTNTYTPVGGPGTDTNASGGRFFVFEVLGVVPGTYTLTATFSTAVSNRQISVLEGIGLKDQAALDGIAFNDQEAVGAGANNVTTGSFTPTAQPNTILSFHLTKYNAQTITIGTSPDWVSLGSVDGYNAMLGDTSLVQYLNTSGTSPRTANAAVAGTEGVLSFAAVWEDAPTASLAQADFRFYNDDGSESTMTAAQAQGVDHSVALDVATVIRVLLQGTNDYPSSAFKLRAQKNGAGGYQDVQVGTPAAASVTWGAIGTSASGTNSCTPSYPASISASTSKLYALVTGRSDTATTAVSAPSGWTLVGALEDGTGTWGVDTGTRRASLFVKDAVTGSESGTVSFAYASGASANSTIRATIFRVEVPAGHSIVAQFGSGADTTNGTGYSATSSSNIDFLANDLLIIGVAQNIDTGTQSSKSISATGVTFGTLTNRASDAVTNGNDHRHILDSVPVSSVTGTPNVAPTYAYTISANGSGPTVFMRLRSVPNQIYIATSSNITAGGENTTQRLTGGSGSFTTGRAWDDENGSDAIDIGNNGNTELVWVLKITGAANADYFDLRVYNGSTALDTYTDTPRLTVGGAVTVAVSGVSATGSAGTVVASGKANAPVSGVSATGSAGTVAAALPVTVQPSGVGSTGSAGTIGTTGAANTPVTGVSGTGSPGAVSVSTAALTVLAAAVSSGEVGTVTVSGAAAAAPTGAEASAAVGSPAVAAAAHVTLVGASATGDPGTVTVSLGATLVALTGAQGDGQVGGPQVTGQGNVPVSGVAATAQAGTVSALVSATVVQLTGVSADGQPGFVQVTGHALIPVTGISAAATLGNLAATTAMIISVPGVQADGSAGSLEVSVSANVPLTGVEAQAIVGTLIAAVAGGTLPPVPAVRTIVVTGLSRNIVLQVHCRTISLPAGSTTITLH